MPCKSGGSSLVSPLQVSSSSLPCESILRLTLLFFLVLVGFWSFVFGSYSQRRRYAKATDRLETKVSGEDNKDIMFFMHGWPDKGEIWDKQVEAFSATHRCITYTMPHFEARNSPSWASTWGYDFDDMVDMVSDLGKTLTDLQNSRDFLTYHRRLRTH
jgi:hypothetical protein